MSKQFCRWVMKAVGQPVEREPFVEQHPLDEIDPVFDAVDHRQIARRVVLVP